MTLNFFGQQILQNIGIYIPHNCGNIINTAEIGGHKMLWWHILY